MSTQPNNSNLDVLSLVILSPLTLRLRPPVRVDILFHRLDARFSQELYDVEVTRFLRSSRFGRLPFPLALALPPLALALRLRAAGLQVCGWCRWRRCAGAGRSDEYGVGGGCRKRQRWLGGGGRLEFWFLCCRVRRGRLELGRRGG